jgi:YHS domain-containing protein
MARHFIRLLVSAQLALVFVASASAEGKINTNDSAYAVGGYDVVAYFTDSKPVKGKPEFSQTYKGARFLFATQAHRELFSKSPDKYMPRYDGYCAYGVSNAKLVPIDPQAFTVRGGVLYLNYSPEIKTKWLADVDARISKADSLFPTLAH